TGMLHNCVLRDCANTFSLRPHHILTFGHGLSTSTCDDQGTLGVLAVSVSAASVFTGNVQFDTVSFKIKAPQTFFR
ncbi:hypothetical protein, partial [Salmonella sp. gx-f7]|uniref:hypothetical protein n=1 Tax=Salmonella sp. gx-f7 TaxID=2582606 RepID=UPI001F33D5BA